MEHNRHLFTRCAAVIIQDGRLLFSGHLDATGEPCFIFPGGPKRENESPEDCAARQALEETGLVVRIEALAYELIWELQAGLRYEAFYLARPEGGTLRGDLDPANPSGEPHPLVWLDQRGMLELACRPTELMHRLPADLARGFAGVPYPPIWIHA